MEAGHQPGFLIAKNQKNEIIIRFLDRIRNTLDEEELEKVILEEITKFFNANRAYFVTTNEVVTI